MNTNLSFGEAYELMIQGNKVARAGWNGKGMYIAIQFPDANSKMKKPYVYMCPVDKLLVPWVASQSDLYDNDWCLVQE